MPLIGLKSTRSRSRIRGTSQGLAVLLVALFAASAIAPSVGAPAVAGIARIAPTVSAAGDSSASCPSTVSGLPTFAVANTQSSIAAIPGALPTLASIGSLVTTVYLGLSPQNVTALDALLAEISTPGSPMYRHYLSHAQFESEFEPSSVAYRAIGQYYNTTYGLQVLPSTDRLSLPLRGTLSALSVAFGTSFGQYTIPAVYSWGTFSQLYYLNPQAIYVPSALASCVTSELGFSNYTGIQPALRINPALGAITPSQAVGLSLTNNGTGSGVPQPPYTPGNLELAYNESGFLHSGPQGQYITIAVTDAYGDPTAQADMASFDAQYNVVAPGSFNVVSPYGGSTAATIAGVTGISSLWEIETALDFEMSHTFAPTANIVSLVSPDAGYTLEETLVYAITTELANVISNSWGSPEPEVGPAANYLHPFFEMAAAEGITVLAASGDQGAAGYDSAVPDSVMWPAADPFVLAVGGTTLAMNGTVSTVSNPVNGPPAVTEVFNPTSRLWEDAWDGYTGGGYSVLYTRPAWQFGEGVPTAGSYAAARGVPDVSANAMFGGNDVVVNGGVNAGLAFGGTSFASPMWAGIIAAIDSYAASVRGNILGYVNPSLYGLFNSPAYSRAFYDITNGSNGPNGVYNCGPGWSPVTGLGSPNIGYLASVLAEVSYTAGAIGDAQSSNSTGVRAQIETVLPQTTYGQSANYAYVRETLPDATVLWTGYTVSTADPLGAWFYALFPASGAPFQTSGIIVGPDGSVGSSGMANTFAIVLTAPNVWSFEMNGQVLGSTSSAFSSAGTSSPFAGVAVLGTGTNVLTVGPVTLSGLSFQNTTGWQLWPAATSVVTTSSFSTGTPAYSLPNPLGVATLSASSASIVAGSGEPTVNGQVLWGVPQPLPPTTVFRNSPATVRLYAEHVATIAKSSQHFPLATTFPSGQANFNSFYLAPVAGPNSWTFSTSSGLATDLSLATGIPLVGHFFLSLGTAQGTASPGVVPVTVVVSVAGGSGPIGTGMETQNLSVTGSPVEYNVSLFSGLSEIRAGSTISMVVSWFEVSTQGESLAWPIVINSGAQYPIALDLATYNPVDVAPLTVASTGSGLEISARIADPFGAYDLASVSATINGNPLPAPTIRGTMYSWAVPASSIVPGSNAIAVQAMDLQNQTNAAGATYVEVVYAVTFSEIGLPSGTGWSVTLNGVTQSSSAATMAAFDEPNGAYSYGVRSSNPTWISFSGGGTLTVSGSALAQTVLFVEVENTVTFAESGLASGTSWSVTLGSTQQSGTGSSITFSEPNGTYAYTIGVPKDYVVSPGSGSVTVSGAAVNVPISFTAIPPNSYQVTFNEQNLPSGTNWSVTLNGVVTSSTTGTISMYETNGTYGYTVISSNNAWVAVSPTGSVTVAGAPATVSVTFVETVYSVTFVETGLPAGSTWAVAVGNVVEETAGSSLAYSEPNGTYSFTVFGPNGYSASPSSGTVTVSGQSVTIQVTFTSTGSGSGIGAMGGSGTAHTNPSAGASDGARPGGGPHLGGARSRAVPRAGPGCRSDCGS